MVPKHSRQDKTLPQDQGNIFYKNSIKSNLFSQTRVEDVMAASSSISIFLSPLNESRWSSRIDDGSNPEEELCRIFKAAVRSGSRSDQLSSLKGLARLLIEKESWIEAAYLLNGTLALTDDPAERTLLIERLEEIEYRSCSYRLWLQPTGRLSHHREELESARKEAAALFENGAPPEEVQYLLTDRYQRLLVTLIEEAIAQIGPPPKGFAVMTLGSMARREASPYSDIEFAFLVRNPSDSAYFKELVKLLHLKMVNIGESVDAHNGFGRVNGFRMDAKLQLIGTPQELAEMQKEEWLLRNSGEITTVNALTTVSFLMGDREIVDAYQKAIDYILDQRPGFLSWFSSEPRLREQRARTLIEGYLTEFEPRLDQDKITLRAFDVKKELYRLPQSTIAALALYYRIKGNNTLELIDLLRVQGIFGEEGANRLKEAFRSILALRIQAHFFYKTECEILYHARGEDDKTAAGLLRMTSELTDRIREIYRTLIPFYQQAELFLKGDLEAFSTSLFYDLTIGTYDDSLRKNFQYNTAHTSALRDVAINPSSPFSQSNLGLVERDLGQVDTPLSRFQEVLALLQQKHEFKDHPSIAKAIWNIGISYENLNNFANAIENYENAIAMQRRIYQEQAHPDLASSLMSLGNSYNKMGKLPEARTRYQESLEMRSYLCQGKADSDLAILLNNLGSVYRKLGKFKKAKKYLIRSLVMKKEIHFEMPYHLTIANTEIELGSLYIRLGKPTKAVPHYQQSLLIREQIHQHNPHSSLADSHMGLGVVYRMLNDFDKSIEHYNRSLKIYKTIYKEKPYSNIADVYNNLGNLYRDIGLFYKSINKYKKSLSLYEVIYKSKKHPNAANAINNLASVYFALEYIEQSIATYQESLSVKEEIYSPNHHNVIPSLVGLTSAYLKKGEIETAITLCERALLICQQSFQHDHPETAATLTGLGDCYLALKRYPESFCHYEQALKMNASIHEGKPHQDTAKTLTGLADYYHEQNETYKSIDYYQKALTIYSQIYESRPHPNIACNLIKLAEIYTELSDYSSASELFERACSHFSRTLGDEASSTREAKAQLDTAIAARDSAPGSSSSSSSLPTP